MLLPCSKVSNSFPSHMDSSQIPSHGLKCLDDSAPAHLSEIMSAIVPLAFVIPHRLQARSCLLLPVWNALSSDLHMAYAFRVQPKCHLPTAAFAYSSQPSYITPSLTLLNFSRTHYYLKLLYIFIHFLSASPTRMQLL